MAANDLLPFWVKTASFFWWPLYGIVLSFVFVIFGQKILINKKRLRQDLPWYERARLIYPALVWPSCCFFFIVIFLLFLYIFYFLDGRLFSLTRPVLSLVFSGLIVYILCLWQNTRMKKRYHSSSVTFGKQIKTVLTLSLIRRPAIWVVPLMFLALPTKLGASFFVVVVGSIVLYLFFIFGLGIILARCLRLIRPLSADAQSVLDEAMKSAGVACHRIYELDSDHANAFAFSTCGAMVFTTRLLKNLPPEELISIYAHEEAHLRESKLLTALRFTPKLLIIALVAFVPLLTTISPERLHAFIMVYMAALCLHVFVKKLARKLEVRADHAAAQMTQNSAVYARALEKIYQLNMTPVVLKQRSATHPDLYDRLVSVGRQPAYERPLPPKKIGVLLLSFILLTIIIILPSLVLRGDRHFRYVAVQQNNLNAAYASMIAMGPVSWDYATTGTVLYKQQKHEDALSFFQAASALGGNTRLFKDAVFLIRVGEGHCEGLQEEYNEHSHDAHTRKMGDRCLGSGHYYQEWSRWMDSVIQGCSAEPTALRWTQQMVTATLQKLVMTYDI